MAVAAADQVLPFDDSLCVREPCVNFERCVSVLKFANASDFIHSDSFLLRPIHPFSYFQCECPPGFTGICRWNNFTCISVPVSSDVSCTIIWSYANKVTHIYTYVRTQAHIHYIIFKNTFVIALTWIFSIS